jgi:hypothetical protein
MAQALGTLIALKDHKNIRGKDKHYRAIQPVAWEGAAKALEAYRSRHHE